VIPQPVTTKGYFVNTRTLTIEGIDFIRTDYKCVWFWDEVLQIERWVKLSHPHRRFHYKKDTAIEFLRHCINDKICGHEDEILKLKAKLEKYGVQAS
jgi:hypothetical protein